MSARTLVEQRLGPFQIERLIGDGAMSEVYAAVDERLGRRVALKVLRPHLARSNEVRRRFATEARLASKLDHPNIVTVYDADEAAGLFYISMQLVEGVDLGRLIQAKGSLSISRTVRIIGQASAALDAAHATGLIHRDVKPANILVTRVKRSDDRVFLTDFGLTKMIGSDSRHTQTGQIIGSVHYMSPEQIEGRETTHLSDVYSLGCVLYECLTGETPFARDTDLAVLWAHVNANVPEVSDRASIPRSVDAVINKALAKAPEDRYESCGELARDLRSAVRRRHLPAPRRRSTSAYVRRVSPDDLRSKSASGSLTRAFKSFVFTASMLALMGGTLIGLARVTGVWNPTTPGDAGDRSRLGTSTPSRPEDEGTTRALGTSRPRDGGGIGDARGDEDLAAFARALGGGGTEATDFDPGIGPISDSQVAEKVSRTVSREYNAASLDGYGQDCIGDNVGCVEFVAQRGERYVSISVDDSSGRIVRAWLKRDVDADGDIDGGWEEVCGQTSDPVRVTPGTIVRIQLQRGECGSVESTPTTGTVTAVFSNRA